jgi:hypothetical protein
LISKKKVKGGVPLILETFNSFKFSFEDKNNSTNLSVRIRKRKVEAYFFVGVCLHWETFLQNAQNSHLYNTKP